MRNSNFALRLQASLMEEAKELAQAEGVALNQLINVAVAEKLAAHRTVAFLERYTQGADGNEAIKLLDRPRSGEPAKPGDELPDGFRPAALQRAIAHRRSGGPGKSRKTGARQKRSSE